MNRRLFLGALGVAGAGAVLDPERLLWVPGRKLISIPKPERVWSVIEAHGLCRVTERWELDRNKRVLRLLLDLGDGVLRVQRHNPWVGRLAPFVPMYPPATAWPV